VSYHLAPSLVALTKEINQRWPQPTWPTVGVGDGWVGDTSHAARKSDHNPDWDRGGVVRAVDIGVQGRDARAILDEVIGDKRAWYVIHKGVIYSRTYGWAANRYTGSNPHNHHIHVSIQHSRGAESDRSPWFGGRSKKRTVPVIDLHRVQQQFRIGRGVKEGRLVPLDSVRLLQRNLNRKYGLKLAVDGIAGPKTAEAWATHEGQVVGAGRRGVPDESSVKALNRRLRVRV
jgi:hypothetical protein